MIILGIETSVRQGGVALCDSERVLAERSLEESRQRHAQTLVQCADRLFREQKLSPRDCGLVAVSIGPGSFTGLRVGVVFGKTLAFTTGCQLVGVDTLLCCARRAPADVQTIWVIADAQRGDLYVGCYHRDAGGVQAAGPIQIVSAAEWCDERAGEDVVTGPAVGRYRDQLTRCRLLPSSLRNPTAREVAAVGRERCLEGATDDPFQLVPAYLRKSSAEEKAEQKTLNARFSAKLRQH